MEYLGLEETLKLAQFHSMAMGREFFPIPGAPSPISNKNNGIPSSRGGTPGSAPIPSLERDPGLERAQQAFP